jgi:GxxExxY protein
MRAYMLEKHRLNDISRRIIASAVTVHHELGPGMLESAYEACLACELLRDGLEIERQKALPLIYRGERLDCGYRVDVMVEGVVIVEIKAIHHVEAVHRAQVLSYLRLSGCKLGLLLNFNVKWLTDSGINRIVNGFPD